MSWQLSSLHIALAGLLLVAAAGCTPQQPFFFCEDGDLSHYLDKATEIEYPDVETASLDEVTGAGRPLTLENPDPSEIWELTLEEAIKLALHNSKVIRSLPQVDPRSLSTMPDFLIRSPEAVPTVYDPALVETNPRFGVAAALAAFDARFSTSAFWEKNDTPRNSPDTQITRSVFEQDLGTFQAQLSKTAATGGTWSLRHNVRYEWNNNPDFIRGFPSDWNVNLEAEFRQPLFQGNGVQFNRIAGPGSIPGFNNGVMIARISTDISLADFEAQVRDLVDQVERAYWTLCLRYHTLEALREGRDEALETWRKVHTELVVGKADATDEAQAKHQYFEFRSQVQEAQSQLYSAENNLRYIMGLAAADGRLIRPTDEPSTAKIDFDWQEVYGESLVRNVDLRREKWRIKQRELELIAAKNYLLPRLDSVGRYRWLGMGDDLIDPKRSAVPFDNAYQSITGGDFQEWQLGLELSIPLGFRKELAGVRYAQLNLEKERAILQDMELELSHQLQEAMRDLDRYHAQAQTNHNKRVAADTELNAWQAREQAGMKIRDAAIDRKLDAQRRVATSKIDYYRALVSYNRAIADVHFRKGSLLEYNGVYLAEGPWPQKAYFDATRRARARDASLYLDYGFTRPKVISRGPVEQHAGAGDLMFDVAPVPQSGVPQEVIPLPTPAPPEQVPAEEFPPPPEAARVLPKAEPEGFGPRLSGTPPGNAAGNTYDLGSLNLNSLVGKPANVAPAPKHQPSAIRPVSYQQVDPPTHDGQPRRAENGWIGIRRSSARHESVANPSTPEADRNASGWKRVQR